MITANGKKRSVSKRGSRAGAVRIAVGVHDGAADVSLRVTRDGPWAGLLGPHELPAADALDALAAAAERWVDAPPERVALVGAPAACLLLVMWLRTIWLGH